MTNENLKVGDAELPELEIVISKLEQGLHLGYPRIINLIKSQQSRIDLLESAIREFLNADDELIVGRADEQIEVLRNLMENKND